MMFTLRIGEPGPAASVADVILQGAGMEVSQPIFGQGNNMPGLQVRGEAWAPWSGWAPAGCRGERGGYE